MSIKIAIGSSDGIVIDEHFGSCKKFYIFEILDEGKFRFIETRELQTKINDSFSTLCNDNVNTDSNSGCGSGCHSGVNDEPGLIEKIDLISNCQATLVRQVGKGAEKQLLKKEINVFEAKGSIEKALLKLYIYYKRTRQIS